MRFKKLNENTSKLSSSCIIATVGSAPKLFLVTTNGSKLYWSISAAWSPINKLTVSTRMSPASLVTSAYLALYSLQYDSTASTW